MTVHENPVCAKCHRAIKPGQMVSMVSDKDIEEARILVSDDVLIVHADANDCGPVGIEPDRSPCCGAHVTYHDDVLICKACFEVVPPAVAVMFKHEDDINGVPIGPLFVRHEGDVIASQPLKLGDTPGPEWFDLPTARQLAADYGVPLEES